MALVGENNARPSAAHARPSRRSWPQSSPQAIFRSLPRRSRDHVLVHESEIEIHSHRRKRTPKAALVRENYTRRPAACARPSRRARPQSSPQAIFRSLPRRSHGHVLAHESEIEMRSRRREQFAKFLPQPRPRPSGHPHGRRVFQGQRLVAEAHEWLLRPARDCRGPRIIAQANA